MFQSQELTHGGTVGFGGNQKCKIIGVGTISQKCIMLGYFEHLKGYKVYNTKTRIISESIHVKFDDKLDLDKSKLVEKFAYMKISYSDSEGGEFEVKDSEDSQHKATQSKSEVAAHKHL